MKKRKFLQFCGAMSVLLHPSWLFASQPCKRLKGVIRYSIDHPGIYCLENDYVYQKVSWGGHTGSGNGQFLSLSCGSVTVDMQGHTLGSEYGMAAVLLRAWFNVSQAKQWPDSTSQAWLDNRFVTIKNGVIDMTQGENTGFGIALADQWSGFYLDKKPRKYTGEYVRNEYTLERLKVLCHASAVRLEGSYSVIRNCVIESSSIAACFIAGPNVLIENCEIRLRRTRKGYMKYDERRAAIVLRDGSNAIIRNNVIRVDYGGKVKAQTHCILVKDGATNVLIEGNTFVNLEGEPVTLEDGSEAFVQNNKFEKRTSWLDKLQERFD